MVCQEKVMFPFVTVAENGSTLGLISPKNEGTWSALVAWPAKLIAKAATMEKPENRKKADLRIIVRKGRG
jgi:hypothetical protein